MKPETDELADLVTIEEAARHARMRRDRAKDLAIRHGIAIRWGGTDRHPRLKVKLSDFTSAILSEVYTPPGAAQKRPSQRRVSVRLNPDVRC